jgi:hypothetical protein
VGLLAGWSGGGVAKVGRTLFLTTTTHSQANLQEFNFSDKFQNLRCLDVSSANQNLPNELKDFATFLDLLTPPPRHPAENFASDCMQAQLAVKSILLANPRLETTRRH